MDGLVERLRAAMGGRPFEAWRVGVDAEARAKLIAKEFQASARVRPPQGFRPDGTRVSVEEKRAILDHHRRRLVEQRAAVAGERRERRVSVYAQLDDDRELPPGHVCPWW